MVSITCGEPLQFILEADDFEDESIGGSVGGAQGEQVPDDVEFICGDHFHWQCLLDSNKMMKCPSCEQDISSVSTSGIRQILCNLTNEGGRQEGLDILPLLAEESYLKAYPGKRKARAFLELCREGDFEAVIDLLKAKYEDDEDEEHSGSVNQLNTAEILRYQDSLAEMQSALHIAVIGAKIELVWLLLFVASDLDVSKFPPQMLEAAQSLELSRDQPGNTDIRTLRDVYDKIPAQYAEQYLGDQIDISVLLVLT